MCKLCVTGKMLAYRIRRSHPCTSFSFKTSKEKEVCALKKYSYKTIYSFICVGSYS